MTLKEFLLPKLTRRFVIRVGIVIAVTIILFKFVLIPIRTRGISMEPTYRDGGFNLCWRMKYLFMKPERGDVVLVNDREWRRFPGWVKCPESWLVDR